MNPGVQTSRILKRRDGRWTQADDLLAREEPLEIRLAFDGPNGQRTEKALSITMRTPGHDRELAVGFLISEGILRTASDLDTDQRDNQSDANIIRLSLKPGVRFDPARLERHFYTTSSCGVCGKGSLEALALQGAPPPGDDMFRVNIDHILALPHRLREAQAQFDQTGGLHATGLFNAAGKLISLYEDVGRHNAFDKVVGAALLAGLLPLRAHMALVSGRASFELVQKAVMAGIPVLAAVGAPSSLAVQLAAEHRLTLIGFVREGRCNVYTAPFRLLPAPEDLP